jgi:archaeal chaperonin
VKALEQLFGDGVRRTKGNEARRYNLLAARLIADLVKNVLGPRGLEKMLIDILGEITITKDGSTILRKIDVEHPAAKVLIESSNAVDNEVGDGTTSVVVLAGALIEKAEELLNIGIAPNTIIDGYLLGLEFSLDALQRFAQTCKNYDRQVMDKIASTCLRSKAITYWAVDCDSAHYNGSDGLEERKCTDMFAKLVVDAIYTIADFANNRVEIDNIKIEEKPGNMSDTKFVKGIVIDKTIDNYAMPRTIENAKILLINEDLEGKRTKTDAEINITSPDEIQSYIREESSIIKSKVQNIIRSGANVVFSQKGISPRAQYYLSEYGIISIRRVKENDLQWLEKSTGGKTIRDLDKHSSESLGFAKTVYEKFVGDDKMVFVEGCKDPQAVTLLLRANSKRALDEFHRSILDSISTLKNYITKPTIVAGGGSVEAIIANYIRGKAASISGREQIVVQKFADALEVIPLTIARNAGMNTIDTITKLRSRYTPTLNDSDTKNTIRWYGVDAVERKIDDMLCYDIIEPSIVKEQVIKTATEVTNLLLRVDDVLIAKQAMYTHTHKDGTQHSHPGGDKKHDHYFDKLGKQQRPMHHYY